ncbi:MAG: GntR family transcriptional regulator [Alphaproteobacteria bacterium]|nr:GntR family transcriptional regulator [Alphaproteobacteria bacterium]
MRELLLRRLEREFGIGDRFPTEKELSGEFGVSRETVREALAWIESEGLITRHRGQGSFVVMRPARGADRRLTGITDGDTRNGLKIKARVLEHGPINARTDVAAALSVDSGKLVYQYVRLSMFQGQPLAVHESYLDLERGMEIARKGLGSGSVMYALEHTPGLEFREDRHRIEAVIADTAVAGLLDVPLGAPLLFMERVHVGADQAPVVAFHSYYRADRYYYTATADRTIRGRACTDTKLAISPSGPAVKRGVVSSLKSKVPGRRIRAH